MVPIITIGILGVALFLIYSNSEGIGSMNIAQYAAQAGWDGQDLVTAIAVALAESGGDPNAYNPEPQDVPGRYGRTSAQDNLGSYGLWQIYLAAHPEFSGDNLRDPQTNANDAYEIYKNAGNSFSAWSTFNSGAYTAHLTVAQSQISA